MPSQIAREFVKRARQQNGGVYLDKRVHIWYYRRTVEGKRKLTPIGTLTDLPTKAKAVRASLAFVIEVDKRPTGITFEAAALRYMAEKMPTHHTTAGEYRNYLKYCIAKWGEVELTAIEPMEVWRWINSLPHPRTGKPLEGKTKRHIKSKMHLVYEFAMLAGLYPISRNPMELVTVKGGSKPSKKKRVLSYQDWERFISFVTAEPQRTSIITCMCLGIRREEIWALKWSDFDFVAGTVQIQRSIIGGRIGPVKTDASEAGLPLDESLVHLLLAWRSKSQFAADTDWVWASPYSAGEMPLYFNAVQRDYIIPASIKAGLGKIGWHTLRHTYRNWMSAAGTPLDVQRDLMRHSNISMTADYGKGVVPAMREANSRVVKMVIQ
jgi:integrase